MNMAAATRGDFTVEIMKYNPDTKKFSEKLPQYMKPGTTDPEQGPSIRFLVADSVVLGIRICLDEGFRYGNSNGLSVALRDTTTNKLITRIYHQNPHKNVHSEEKALRKDKQQKNILIGAVSGVILGGEYKENVRLELVPITQVGKYDRSPGAAF